MILDFFIMLLCVLDFIVVQFIKLLLLILLVSI